MIEKIILIQNFVHEITTNKIQHNTSYTNCTMSGPKASNDLVWSLIRNTSSFRVKRGRADVSFSFLFCFVCGGEYYFDILYQLYQLQQSC